MSNIKDVKIVGELKVFAHEDDELIYPEKDPKVAENIRTLYAQLNAPSFGIRLKWGQARQSENDFFYKYEISGREAVSYKWIDWVVKVIEESGGTAVIKKQRDMENT